MLLEFIISLYFIINYFVLTGFIVKTLKNQPRRTLVADLIDAIEGYSSHPYKRG